MTEQRTTPEQRAALRERYGPLTDRRCLVCGAPMYEAVSLGVWICAANRGHHRIPMHKGDPAVLAAVDDADALAGALAEIEHYRAALERLRNAAQFGIEGMDTAEVLNAIVADADAVLASLAPETKGAE